MDGYFEPVRSSSGESGGEGGPKSDAGMRVCGEDSLELVVAGDASDEEVDGMRGGGRP